MLTIRIFLMVMTAISFLGVFGEKENEKMRESLTVITMFGIGILFLTLIV